jgi:hypothetical protein
MPNLSIRLREHDVVECCSLCRAATACEGGPRLSLTDGAHAVCRECGKKHAPSLVALLDLARAANRVGRIGRHTITPPLTALLALARAAEDFTYTVPRRPRAA